MSEKDVSRITVSELAEKAMINRKTFYRHYNCINDVLDQIENVIVDGVSNILNHEHTAVFEPHILFHGINNLMNENWEFYSALFRMNSGEFIAGKIRDAVRDALLAVLREISTAEEEVLEACAEFAVSGILSLYSKWFSEGRTQSLDELADIACKMTVEGITGIADADAGRLIR